MTASNNTGSIYCNTPGTTVHVTATASSITLVRRPQCLPHARHRRRHHDGRQRHRLLQQSDRCWQFHLPRVQLLYFRQHRTGRNINRDCSDFLRQRRPRRHVLRSDGDRQTGGVTFNSTTNTTYAGAMSGNGSHDEKRVEHAHPHRQQHVHAAAPRSAPARWPSAAQACWAAATIARPSPIAARWSSTPAATSSSADSISGSGALYQLGSGTLTLTGGNSYTGGTTVAGGVLAATTTASLANFGTAGSLAVQGGAMLDLSAGGSRPVPGRRHQ